MKRAVAAIVAASILVGAGIASFAAESEHRTETPMNMQGTHPMEGTQGTQRLEMMRACQNMMSAMQSSAGVAPQGDIR